jgi:hypothetical protein
MSTSIVSSTPIDQERGTLKKGGYGARRGVRGRAVVTAGHRTMGLSIPHAGRTTPAVPCTVGHRESPVGIEFLRLYWPNQHDSSRFSAREDREVGPILVKIAGENRFRPSVRGVLALAAQAVARGNQSAKPL